MKHFPIAPMSALFRILTILLVPVPAIMLAGAVANTPARPFLAGTAVFMGLIFAIVYFAMRPTRFELDDHELRIVFPLRKIAIARSRVARAETLGWPAFVARYPRPIRVGAGGLWGGFGSLMTKSGRVQFYISRQDQLVLLEFDDRRPLLITPEEPSAFVAALRQK